MLSDNTSGGVGIWGLVIFFLILFWMCGGNGGFGGFGCGNRGLAWAAAGEGLTDRDVLQLGTSIVQQNSNTQGMLKDIAYQQEKGVAAILNGQKDLYIRDLERVATQQFITSQTDALSAKMDNLAAAGALQRQADLANVQAQLNAISCQMLKAPQPIPIVGLSTVGCTNGGFVSNFGWNGCNGCNGCNS